MIDFKAMQEKYELPDHTILSIIGCGVIDLIHIKQKTIEDITDPDQIKMIIQQNNVLDELYNDVSHQMLMILRDHVLKE